MELRGNARQVWVFIGEHDQWHGQPLHLAILEMLKREGCAGGTTLRGIAGFGTHSLIHTTSLVELSSDLPIVVTFVEHEERVARVLPRLQEMVTEGMITMLPVEIVKYSSRTVGPFPAHLSVADVMTRDVQRVAPDTPAAEIVTLLIDRALRAVPVVDERQHVIGIITDGDLLQRGLLDLPIHFQQVLPLTERAAAVNDLQERPQRAAELMTRAPHTLPDDIPLAQAARQLAEHNLKRMPVVDADERLVGVVSRSDLLSTIAEGLRQRPTETVMLPVGAPQTVADVMLPEQEVVTVQPSTPLVEALDRLLERPQRRVIVLDEERRVVGIITDGDLLRRAARVVQPGVLRRLTAWFSGGELPPELAVVVTGRTAGEVMSKPVITVRTTTPIAEAVRQMMPDHIKYLPVVDDADHLVGLVGRAGLMRALAHRSETDQTEQQE